MESRLASQTTVCRFAIRSIERGRVSGAYLRVVSSGMVSAGDEIVVAHRPAHEVTVALMFRALTLEPNLIPSIVAAADSP
jgi:MOSC domain-containing protein YiiM